MATWNWSEVLPFSIGSALDQSFDDFELLVVGDGCTDDSEEVVAAIGDPRIRWINLPENHGHQSAPNNEGLRQARGELVAYLGHDDLWLPHHLACLVAAIDHGADLAYGITRFVTRGDDDGCFVLPDFCPGDWLPPTSVIHCRALFAMAGGWPDCRSLDGEPEAELWRRYAAAGAQVRLVPRLTAIKLPASARANVYRERPCHEQSAWLKRIRSSDVEAEELAADLIARARSAPRRYSAFVREVVQRGAAGLLARVRRKLVPSAPGDAVDRRRSYKGLPGRGGNETLGSGVQAPSDQGAGN